MTVALKWNSHYSRVRSEGAAPPALHLVQLSLFIARGRECDHMKISLLFIIIIDFIFLLAVDAPPLLLVFGLYFCIISRPPLGLFIIRIT